MNANSPVTQVLEELLKCTRTDSRMEVYGLGAPGINATMSLIDMRLRMYDTKMNPKAEFSLRDGRVAKMDANEAGTKLHQSVLLCPPYLNRSLIICLAVGLGFGNPIGSLAIRMYA